MSSVELILFQVRSFTILGTDSLAGQIIHDTGHLGQGDPEIDSDAFIENEKKASSFVLGVALRLAVDAAGISVKVRAHYPGRSVSLSRIFEASVSMQNENQRFTLEAQARKRSH